MSNEAALYLDLAVIELTHETTYSGLQLANYWSNDGVMYHVHIKDDVLWVFVNTVDPVKVRLDESQPLLFNIAVALSELGYLPARSYVRDQRITQIFT